MARADTKIATVLLIACAGAAPAAQSNSAMEPFVIYFPTGGASVGSEAAPVLDNVAAAWQRTRSAQILVSAHADRAGSDRFNLRLSQRRADAARAHLIRRAVPDAFISSNAVGEAAPAVPTADGVGEPRNRRVEIRLLSPLGQ